MKIGRYTYHLKRAPTPKPEPEPPTKRALLIGMTYARAAGGFSELKGPHADVRAMRALLVERYGYQEADVVVLLDDGEGVVPTRVNILKAIGDLVGGARKGDRFFFHYCGHTMQMPNRSNSEEDGLDECLVPADGEGQKIMDNNVHSGLFTLRFRILVMSCHHTFLTTSLPQELRHHLIDALPVGSSLVAVFDSCHSASLLDLAHFRCNRVYVPWLSKGRRRSDDRWNAVAGSTHETFVQARVGHLVCRRASPSSACRWGQRPGFRRRLRASSCGPEMVAGCLMVLLGRVGMRCGVAARDHTIHDGLESAVRAANATLDLWLRRLALPPATPVASRKVTKDLTTAPIPPIPAHPHLSSLPPTEPSSPLSPPDPRALHDSPLVTTRRIYEAARTSTTRVRAWRTAVDELEVEVGPESWPSRPPSPTQPAVGVGRAATENDKTVDADAKRRRKKKKRMTLPTLRSLSGSSSIWDDFPGGGGGGGVGGKASKKGGELVWATKRERERAREMERKGNGGGGKSANGKGREKEKARRTNVVRAQGVSIAVRPVLGAVAASPAPGAGAGVDGAPSAINPSSSAAGKENAGVVRGGAGPRRPSLKPLDIPGSGDKLADGTRRVKVANETLNADDAQPRKRTSWFGEDGEDDGECESPEPVWVCQGWACHEPGHGHKVVEEAEVISLASCKDYQLSWEDENGGSMTRELVKILERDPHPTLRALVTNVSHAMHRLSLERHLKVRQYKRACKIYETWKRQHEEQIAAAAAASTGDSSSMTGDSSTAPSHSPFSTPASRRQTSMPTSASRSRASTLWPITPALSPTPSRTSTAPASRKSTAPMSRKSTAPVSRTSTAPGLCNPTAPVSPTSTAPSSPTNVLMSSFAALAAAGRWSKAKRMTNPRTNDSRPQARAKSEGFAATPLYDMDNFQNPQVASHQPLDMERPWSM
ncbi:caspase domain-containing protein [Mycena sp. CBHHK59/15]|nr:caspase domain-containing protein [Mycena sp. CBHHK59/15]